MSEKNYMDVIDPWLRIRVENLAELVEAVDLSDFDSKATEIDKEWMEIGRYEDRRRKRLAIKRGPELEKLTVRELTELHKELAPGLAPARKPELLKAVLDLEWRSGAVWKAYRDARSTFGKFDRWRDDLKHLPTKLQDLVEEAEAAAARLPADTPSEAMRNMRRYGMRGMVAEHLAESAKKARLLHDQSGYYPAVIELINEARVLLFHTSTSRMGVSMDGANEVAKLLAARELLSLVPRWLPASVRPYFPSR